MRKLILTCSILFTLADTPFAQTLFKYGTNPVEKEEFLRVYKKNAINQQPDYSETALREYLDLYSLFRMKVKEAELQRIDTITSIQYELGNYRKQLAQAYLTDDEINKKQIEEAYERMKEVVKVAHILILSSPMAQSKDTVAPYKTIDSLYTAATKGKADFGKLASIYSDDRGSKAEDGVVGYITALQTVYAFENVAYNTPVGKVSKPFRTQYGYHILKVLDKKPSPGQVEVAQIMIAAPKAKGPEADAEALKKAQQVKAELAKGGKFEELVKKYSEDRYSKDNGGVLEKFSTGSYVPEFENAAFSLKKPGDISDVVRTEYGYHILKLIKKYPILPFDSMQAQLKSAVARDDRSQVAKDVFFNSIKKKNNFKEYPENVDKLRTDFATLIADTGRNAGVLEAKSYNGPENTLFEIKGVKYKAGDLLSYAETSTRGRVVGPKGAIYDNIYDNYVRMVVNDIEEENLMNEKPEFKNLMTEYRDGIMLFELMDRNVWGKASKDSVGLATFHKTRAANYKWQSGFRGAVYTFKSKEAMDDGIKLLTKKNMSDEELVKKMNTDKAPGTVNIQKGYYEFNKYKDYPKESLKKDTPTETKKNEDGTYTFAIAREIYENGTTKTLDEARGYVIAEYQDYLEKNWNESLRKKYPVTVNEDVFKSMVK